MISRRIKAHNEKENEFEVICGVETYHRSRFGMNCLR